MLHFHFFFDNVGCWDCVFVYLILTIITLWKWKQTICMNFSFSILLMIQRLAARICCDWKEIKRRTFDSVSFPGKAVQLYIDQDLWQDSSKKWGRARRLRWEVGRRKKSGSLSWLMEADTFTRFFNSWDPDSHCGHRQGDTETFPTKT